MEIQRNKIPKHLFFYLRYFPAHAIILLTMMVAHLDPPLADLREPSVGYIYSYALTYRGRDKMAAIFQTAFSKAFSWMKMY